MDKAKLKQTLKEQHTPLLQSIQQKLTYLQSENVFNAGYYSAPKISSSEDDSLLNAFTSSNNNVSAIPAYQAPSPAAVQQMQQAPQPKPVSDTQNSASNSASAQNMAARIAALRGISMPGDYLRKK